VREYYEQRAPEYDDWWNGTGLFAQRERPGWHEEVAALVAALGALPPARTLDVACGTAFLGRHLPGDVTGLDASPAMLAIAAGRLSRVVEGDALDPPFPDGAFERVATGHFYGHLEALERERFLARARRLAPELLVIDSARRGDVPAERMDPRVLNDGSRHAVYKRWFEPDELVAEIGGAVVHAGRWFVAVRA
jgi:demethylmenaquinone methyltransferase/2-methoxy-6-polyprenyl-1,4-benzoquinol methylase